MILFREFYEENTLTVARRLLGQYLVRQTEQGITCGRIVETEAYLGSADPAAHSYRGKTPRVNVQYGPAGHAYIYLIYGMYFCMNITTGPLGAPEVVLLRALEPVSGIDLMRRRRKTDALKNLCSGPGKLCMAMDIDRSLYGCDLCSCASGLYLMPGDEPEEIEATPRIGIDYAGAAAAFPWRFTVRGSQFLSK